MESTRLKQAYGRADKVNMDDPTVEEFNGKIQPSAWVYSQRMKQRLDQFQPNAGELLQIAAYCQHIKRWTLPRSSYPMNRAGYLGWREKLKTLHGDITQAIMLKSGYEEKEALRVRSLLGKKHLRSDPESQVLEDVICLVFLEHYLHNFSKKHDDEKVKSIIQKTWKKMSPRAREAAMDIPFNLPDGRLIQGALEQGHEDRLH